MSGIFATSVICVLGIGTIVGVGCWLYVKWLELFP